MLELFRRFRRPWVPQVIKFTPSGDFTCVGTMSGKIWVLNFPNGDPARIFGKLNSGITALDVSSDGNIIVGASIRGEMAAWDFNTGEIVVKFQKKADTIRTLEISRDNKWVLAGADFGTSFGTSLWDLKSGKYIKDVLLHRDYVTQVAFERNGNRMISSSMDGKLSIAPFNSKPYGPWKDVEEYLEEFGHREVIETPYTIKCFVETHDGRYIITGHGNHLIINNTFELIDEARAMIWEKESKEFVQEFIGHKDHIVKVDISPDDRYLISASSPLDAAPTSIALWDVKTGEPLYLIENPHYIGMTSIAFSPDGKWLISSAIDGTIRIWKVNA